MMKKIKKEIKKMPKKLTAFMIVFAMVFSYFSPLTNLSAATYGEGDRYIHLDIANTLNFTINSVTVNGYDWDGASDEFRSNDEQYHIVISVSGNENTNDMVPLIQYGGNWNDYITPSTQHNGNDHTFVLDLNNTEHQDFLGLEILQDDNNNQGSGNEPNFDGKAYVLWSCGSGTCYHYFENIPDFNDGRSTFYKDTTIKADNDNTKTFDVNAQYKGWALPSSFDILVNAYKSKYNVSEVDWTNVDPSLIIGNPPDMREWEEAAINAGDCTTENTPQDEFQRCVDNYMVTHSDGLPFIKLQPVGEPEYPNVYVSYGDRNFKIAIYNDDFKGITMGDLSTLNYYPSSWANAFIMRDFFDVSGTSQSNPSPLNSILLESTVKIKALNYNSFSIASIEALDVPDDAIAISKSGDEYSIVFSSNFYDDVVFKITDTDNEVSYMRIKRYTIDGWVANRDNGSTLIADFYFNRSESYSDFDLTAKVILKNGETRKVTLTAKYGIDDGLGNITPSYESDEESPMFGPAGKGLKKSTFECPLDGIQENDIDRIYLNAEYKGSTSTTYAGAYVGSGEGVLANLYQGGGN